MDNSTAPAPAPPPSSSSWSCSFCCLQQSGDQASLNCSANKDHRLLCCRACANERKDLVCPFCVPPPQPSSIQAPVATPVPTSKPVTPPVSATLEEKKEAPLPSCSNSSCNFQGELELHIPVCHYRTVTCPKDGCEKLFQVINAVSHFDTECEATPIPCPRGGTQCSTHPRRDEAAHASVCIFHKCSVPICQTRSTLTLLQTSHEPACRMLYQGLHQSRQLNEQNQQRLTTSMDTTLRLQAEIKQLKKDKEELKSCVEMWWKAGSQAVQWHGSQQALRGGQVGLNRFTEQGQQA